MRSSGSRSPSWFPGVRRQRGPNCKKPWLPLADPKTGLVELVADPVQAHWVLRVDQGKLGLVEACGNRAPFALPSPDSPGLSHALRQSIEKIYRARNLVAVSSRFESERSRGASAVDIEVQVLRHKNQTDPGEVVPVPAGGWVFRPGDLISFGVRNKTESMRLDVTLLVIGSDFEISPFYPQPGELGQILEPGATVTTPAPWGEISNDPPFGPENLVVIAVPATNPPTDFTALRRVDWHLPGGPTHAEVFGHHWGNCSNQRCFSVAHAGR